jgi:SAM-dependent methyltransferase
VLVLTHASFARVDQLFRYKAAGFELPPFPGYTVDQWGIKAHNRPWIEEAGRFQAGQRIVEVGGAYSRLPEYLGNRYKVDPWVADDFGMASDEPMWARWGDPRDLPRQFPTVTYVFRRLGDFAPELPSASFDRVFSVSTLEHIPHTAIPAVLKDMHRLLAPGGIELHTIDIPIQTPTRLMAKLASSWLPPLRRLNRRLDNDVRRWIEEFRTSGVRIETRPPNLLPLFARSTLVESPDVVYRFYPPNDAPKPYTPSASLLLVIEDR